MIGRGLVVALIFMAAASVFGQQQASYAQYMFNGMSINPAYAGSQNALSVSFLSRFQNVGLDGAPNTQTFCVHSPLSDQDAATGLMFIRDHIGVITQTGVSGAFAYRLKLSNGARLSMGVQAGITSYRADYTQLVTAVDDPLFQEDIRQTRPNFGAGVYYSTSLAFIGMALPHMVNNVFKRGSSLATVYQNKPLIINGGYVFTINHLFKLKPNFLLKVLDDRPVELDLNANLLVDNVLWIGASYRFSNTFSGILELQLTDQLRLGYAYSVVGGPLRYAELGSHEVLLNYRFSFNMKGIVTPRYF